MSLDGDLYRIAGGIAEGQGDVYEASGPVLRNGYVDLIQAGEQRIDDGAADSAAKIDRWRGGQTGQGLAQWSSLPGGDKRTGGPQPDGPKRQCVAGFGRVSGHTRPAPIGHWPAAIQIGDNAVQTETDEQSRRA